jgi:hypothetical protein
MLQVDGRSCTVHRDTEEYENIEFMRVMVPWNGDETCMIDRFDARSMLDFYREPKNTIPCTEQEDEIEQVIHLRARYLTISKYHPVVPT